MPGAVPPMLTSLPVPESKALKNRRDAEVQRLLDLGARHADVGQGEVTWVVLADP